MPNPKDTSNPAYFKSQLKAKTPDSIWKLFETAATCADNLKMDVYLVGGCIRDFLLDKETLDWDLVVQGDGPQLGDNIAAKLNGKTHKKGQFLTCAVVLDDNIRIDIATTRSETYKHPAALPEVQKSSIDEDLLRRDFSINALALKLNGEDSFYLIDKYNGLPDLNEGLIRVLHSKSFLDDPTRGFRAIRFEKRFGFLLETETYRLLKEALSEKVFDRLSGFRIFNELKKILQEKQPKLHLLRCKEIGLLQIIHPDLFDRPTGAKLLDNIERTIQEQEKYPFKIFLDNWKVYFLGLLYYTPKISRQACLSRLDIKGKEADSLQKNLELVEKALMVLDNLEDLKPIAVYEALHELSGEAVTLLNAMANTENVKKSIFSYFSNYRERAVLKVNGDDLIKLGFSPGPTFQKILENLKRARLMEDIQTKNDEIDWIQRNFNPNKN